MPPMVEIQNLVKRYGTFCAVNDLSLTIEPGEIFGFLGVNGAGKTTTLKILAGLLRPTSGRVLINGRDVSHDPIEVKKITGYIPDRPHLYPKLTGREFLYFMADLYRLPHPRAEERAEDLLREYGLLEWQDELIESYSHGMKQRLATCAGVLHEPRILIVDEPMVGLDPHGARMLKDSLREYARSGMSVLLSTHSLNVAEEVSDRLAIIHRGTLLASGTLPEIRHQYGGFSEGLEQMFLSMTSNAH